MAHGQSDLRRPDLLPARGLPARPKRQAPAARGQEQHVSTTSLHKVHLRGRAELRARVIAHSLTVACDRLSAHRKRKS